MKLEAEQVLCRFHLLNLERHGSEPLYSWIVNTARKHDLQGATVLKGFMGLSPDGTIIMETPWALAQAAPVVVEIIDGPRHIEKLLVEVEPVFTRGAITLERAHIVLYRASGAESRPKDSAARYDVVGTKGDTAAWEVKTMKIPENGVLLRIFVGESDREPERGIPLYEAIVRRASEAHLAGATVLKGPMGFGRHSRVHSATLLALSTDLPIVVEIVDAEDRIRSFLPVVDELVTEGLVTLEAVRVIKYVSPDAKG